MSEELMQIKKLYGEGIMHLCHTMFPQHLQKDGLVLDVLTKTFAPTHLLYVDIVNNGAFEEFENYVNSVIYSANEHEDLIDTGKTPQELFAEVGYDLCECHSEEDIQAFKKYYYPGEELCTFKGNRLDRCHVFFAVKKNVDEIKREDFSKPEREDLYGTSVISVQFTKGEHSALSIKNRYNHTVTNPDATFHNNLELINLGLTKSFEEYYKIKVDIQDYGLASKILKFFLKSQYVYSESEKRYYRYNVECDGTYFCENNYIIYNNGKGIDDTYVKDKARFLIIDRYVIDLKEKRIFTLAYVNESLIESTDDSFVKSIYDVGEISKIEIKKNDSGKKIIFKYINDKISTISIDKSNAIIGYENNYVEKIEDGFLETNRTLTTLTLNNATEIGENCLHNDREICDLSLSSVRVIKRNSFCSFTRKLTKLLFPELEELQDGCFQFCINVNELFAPKLKYIGSSVLEESVKLNRLDLPSIITIGYGFLANFRFVPDEEPLEISGMSNLKKLGMFFASERKVFIIDPKAMCLNIDSGILSREVFLNALSTEKGIIIADRQSDLDFQKGDEGQSK